MVSGVSIKFRSYSETVPKLLDLIKLEKELKKHNRIILKPIIKNSLSRHTNPEFVEAVLRYCLINKKAEAKIFIAEGADGEETSEVFDKLGYKKLSERYSVSLIDLNTSEVEEIVGADYLKFDKIKYPKILLDSFVITLPFLSEDTETEITSSLSTMLGAYPGKYYRGFFTQKKNKIRSWPIKYSIHDILRCKMPDFSIVDASEQGFIITGKPLATDKQASKLLGKDWRSVAHLRLADERIPENVEKKAKSEIAEIAEKVKDE